MTDGINDNCLGGPRETDAAGQAAILLVESLIHGLVARSILSVHEAVEIVNVATDVTAAVAADLGESTATTAKSLVLLQSISASLQLDATI